MKQDKRIKKILKILFSPTKWYGKKSLMTIILLYMGMGIVLRMHLYFPYFYMYFCIFSVIGIITWSAIYYYIKHFPNITVSIVKQNAAQSANAFYYKYIFSNPYYVVFPCLVVVIFGYGGCNMFSVLSINLLFIWIMILFSFVVYISIVGYIQYIFLAIYIFKLALSKQEFAKLSHSIHECIPAEIEWIRNLTKISHIYRNVFFTIGSLYILAFAFFCYLPDFKANRESLFYSVLWGIIFIAIVLIFPIVSILEHIWIKKIVGKIKKAYISDLKSEADLLRTNSQTSENSMLYTIFLENIYALRINESRNYPITSIWSTGYSMVLSLFNLFAAIITVAKGLPIFLDVLRQNS